MNKEKISKMLILIVSIFGLYIHINSGFKVYGYAIFYFFTVLSNIAVFFYYSLYFVISKRMSNIIQGYVLEPILLTGILNWFILAPASIKYYGSILPLFHPSNFFVHGLIPILVLLDWVMFSEKGIYKKYDPLKWCVFPIIYSIFIYIRALFGGDVFNGSPYPYPFYSPQDMGNWANVLICLLFISVIYLLGGYVLYYLKKNKKTVYR
ncbi:Pr6Pr family membrane protein [Lactococcus lactis]|uniref:Integral membrane protein n=2 Tax=Lactococcus lactis TaxID=1358 RepID=A0A2A5SIX6_LACLH|nr:Pr6Pr family membrane protein [Lactococcus lactis]KAA8703593.1 hypothetical protein F4V48_04470 [Lactococcus lactis subsp. hordniae]KSU05955.1 hypothetical protein LMG8520_2264 [Lactococcus lactis subsp. lactis]MBK5076360.1 Pr6Pr family membrane protein [Lactococcus lactis]MCT3133958.1 hypothetical protein [Lactococcus lactis]PCS13398.1 hypothetical protein RU90_GL002362 [Lactococcus lactis subsp. hordniae]